MLGYKKWPGMLGTGELQAAISVDNGAGAVIISMVKQAV